MNADHRTASDSVSSPAPAGFGRAMIAAAFRPLLLVLCVSALFWAAPARADEIAPFLGQRYGGSFADSNTAADFKVADAGAFGLVLDFDSEPGKQIEVLFSRQNTNLSTGDPLFTGNPLFDLTIDYYHIGGLYMLPDYDRVRPFVSGTFGVTSMVPKRPDLTTENRLSISLGTGAKIFFNRNLGLRFDLRGIYTMLNGDTSIFCSGGCTVKVVGSGFVQTEISAALMMRF